MTRPQSDVDLAQQLVSSGTSIAATARLIGCSRAAVRDWTRPGYAPKQRRSGPCDPCPWIYEYPRYMFTNASLDIHGLFSEACSRVGVESRWTTERTVAVSRAQDVALLDEFIGPKA